MPEFNYERHEIQRVLDAGPAVDEDWFRLQVSGKVECRHLSITADQLAAIRDLLAGEATANKIKLAEQALAAHKRNLATAADKDQVRRQIAAAQRRLNDLRKATDTTTT